MNIDPSKRWTVTMPFDDLENLKRTSRNRLECLKTAEEEVKRLTGLLDEAWKWHVENHTDEAPPTLHDWSDERGIAIPDKAAGRGFIASRF